MSGHVSGVQTQLKKRRDGVLYTHCVAHLLELTVLDVIKFEDTYIEMFNDTLNGIFKYYYNSAVRRNELKLIADIFEEEVKKLGLLKKMRWVTSRARALNLIESNYQMLIYDLEQKSYMETAKQERRLLDMSSFLNSPSFCSIYFTCKMLLLFCDQCH